MCLHTETKTGIPFSRLYDFVFLIFILSISLNCPQQRFLLKIATYSFIIHWAFIRVKSYTTCCHFFLWERLSRFQIVLQYCRICCSLNLILLLSPCSAQTRCPSELQNMICRKSVRLWGEEDLGVLWTYRCACSCVSQCMQQTCGMGCKYLWWSHS